MKLGDMVDGHQVISQAPVEFSGRGARVVEGRTVTGSYSEGFWGFGPQGWVVIRRWKCKASPKTSWSPAIPALDVVVLHRTVMAPGEELSVA